jgi:amidophosphoribosyltransferase
MCGVIGIISKENRDDLGTLIGYGLYQLQHRGDFSAGITTVKKLPMSRKDYRRNRLIASEHTISDFEPVNIHKGRGKVGEVFNEENLEKLVGFMGIGQVRYPTAGYTMTQEDALLNPCEKSLMNDASIQPMYNPYSRIALVHNGDVHNYHDVMRYFSGKNLRKAGNNDVEALLKVFSEEFFKFTEETSEIERLENTVMKIFERVKGTYSALAVVNNLGIVAFRDPEGRRPLLYGVKKDDDGNITDYAFASETVALEKMLFKGTKEKKCSNGCNSYEEVMPGEFVFISKDFKMHKKRLVEKGYMPCPFEGSYFARAPSYINDRRVKQIRRSIIDSIWERFTVTEAYKRITENIDDAIIVAVPRTAESAAKYLSNKTNINLEDAIEKNAYAPRIFQQPTQEHRVKQTIADHYIFDDDVKGKIVLLIDDSIVRGTTMIEDIKYLKDVGAKEIHLFITFPPIKYPCMHAIDFHTSEELIAHGKSTEEIKHALGLSNMETLNYATPDDIRKASGYENVNMCKECYVNGL